MTTLAEIKARLETECGYNGVAELNQDQGFVHLGNDFIDMMPETADAWIIANCRIQTTDKGCAFSPKEA